MVTTWGRGSFGVHDAAQRFADNCNAISGGTLEIDLKANGELVSGTAAAFDAMTSVLLMPLTLLCIITLVKIQQLHFTQLFLLE